MNLNVYSVYDLKAKAFLSPFFLPQDAMAVRALIDAVEDPNHQFAKHPEDYQLFRLGQFDDELGVLSPSPEHALLIQVSSLVRRVPDTLHNRHHGEGPAG